MNKLLIGMFIFISLLIFTVYTVHSEEDVKFYNQYNRNDLTDYRNCGKGYWLLFILNQTLGDKEPKAEWQLKKPTITIGELEYKQANK